VASLDRTFTDGIKNLKRPHDLTRREGLDYELAIGQFAYTRSECVEIVE
jgi:hypothetical protein